jgi:hypothetical protein
MRRAWIAATVIAVAVACGGDKAPTAPVVVAPTPTPTPTPLGLGLACGLPAMAECGQVGGPAEGSPPGVYGCCTKEGTDGSFRDRIGAAITRLQAEQPSLFNGDRVLDREAYQLGVARILERDFRLCAKPGLPGDEVAVKDSNTFSEQYDIYQSNTRTFNPPGYAVTCRPARF